MFTTIKMFIGFLFAIALGAFCIYKRKDFGTERAIATAAISLLGSLIFLGQFISRLG